ncbi:Molybdenum cofactor sulfurase [Talaromyces atroroseus]|uniref:Molybdenum cofactor sulfurase n=1 Tax=Talaromyces atroroseus TaxID=1441469 RepID=A0A225AH64_TALAT|nr:Molybdenum cofactor sulfurase [Talaromyces atroroseus]OKL56368.1 Molybdenum cofactor sulfurase [Talaromyces atroroseus]
MADEKLDIIGREFYPEAIDEIRDREYPSLRDTTYLDHAGTALYARSLVENYSRDLTENLFGNPHSASASSQLTSSRIEDIRLQALRFFNADPDVYDLVFVPNATAGIKLVADTLRDFLAGSGQRGFWYGYHVDSHTSLVGVRELADLGNHCFTTDDEVRQWVNNEPSFKDNDDTKLFAYPAQSNMNGRRLPLRWCDQIRNLRGQTTFTLLDAASLVSTAPLDLSDPRICPDFTVVSFYKIFGFPDLGALIVRKESGHIFKHRKFFGGGTVDMVTVGHQWHAKKQTSIHEQLEDGTLPFHNIIALDSALRVHNRLYGSMSNISAHTSFLSQQLYNRLSLIKHANGMPVCNFYMSGCSYEDPTSQGPILALNLLDSNGGWLGKSEIEKLASVKAIHIRSGTLCNPGGTASLLGLSHEEMEANYTAGQRCGDEHDIMQGKPTGALRLSLGAMTSSRDIDRFVAFIAEFYAERAPLSPPMDLSMIKLAETNRFYVESLCVYPIKSCSGFPVPPGVTWQVHPEGLEWDREWCIVHQGTGAALSQKRYPRMALIKPILDLGRGFLRITGEFTTGRRQLDISLRRNDAQLVPAEIGNCQSSSSVRKSSLVCGDRVIIQVYSSAEVSSFFSDLLGVPCTLARFPPQSYSRHARTSLPPSQHPISRNQMPGSFPLETSQRATNNYSRANQGKSNPILLSNESPILLISRSSVNRLNEQIKESSIAATGLSATNNGYPMAVAANVFRANIVVAENLPHSSTSTMPYPSFSPCFEQPYVEDTWSSFTVGAQNLRFDILGSCQRCQMVCVDQLTAERREEPLSTLAKTRRVGGKIFFGRHAGLSALEDDTNETTNERVNDRTDRFIMVGDIVIPSFDIID